MNPQVKDIVEAIENIPLEEVEDGDNPKLMNLMNELQRIDPWNDILHAGCASYPNCDIQGCH